MPAIAVPPGTRVTWRVTERDVTTTGAVHVDVQGIQPLITGDMPAGAGAPRYTVHTRSVTEDGRRALWELLDELRPYVSATLEAENRLIAREFDGLTGTETEGWGAVDNTSAVSIRELEDIEASLLYGVDHETESPVLRMAKRSALTNINNQPLGAWWERNIRSRAEERIRRHIGDPSIGTKVRRLAAEYLAEADAPSVDGLLAAYRERHPGDRAGRDRIVAALTAGRTIDALSYSLAEHDEGDAL
jgi:DNA-binding MarR family transcriptional regulator